MKTDILPKYATCCFSGATYLTKNVTSIFTHVTSTYPNTLHHPVSKSKETVFSLLALVHTRTQQVSTTIFIKRTYQNSTRMRNTFPGLAAHSCIASKAPSGLAILEISSSTGQIPSFI